MFQTQLRWRKSLWTVFVLIVNKSWTVRVLYVCIWRRHPAMWHSCQPHCVTGVQPVTWHSYSTRPESSDYEINCTSVDGLLLSKYLLSTVSTLTATYCTLFNLLFILHKHIWTSKLKFFCERTVRFMNKTCR